MEQQRPATDGAAHYARAHIHAYTREAYANTLHALKSKIRPFLARFSRLNSKVGKSYLCGEKVA